jgi:hypothetical protein
MNARRAEGGDLMVVLCKLFDGSYVQYTERDRGKCRGEEDGAPIFQFF